MDKDNMKIAITGHRPNKLGNDYNLTSPLSSYIKEELQKIIENYNPDTMITGMALGIDTLWAKLAIENQIPFIAAIPCWEQDSRWIKKSKEIYNSILANPLCNIYQVTATPYSNTCMQIRNEWMVDNCDILVAVWDGTKGGTANCIKYAEKVGKEIILIDLNNFYL